MQPPLNPRCVSGGHQAGRRLLTATQARLGRNGVSDLRVPLSAETCEVDADPGHVEDAAVVCEQSGVDARFVESGQHLRTPWATFKDTMGNI